MKAEEIIQQISRERGMDTRGVSNIELVPLNDLNVHKREVWNMSITHDPDNYFLNMNRKFNNKIGYSYRFKIRDLDEGKELCSELSRDFGTPPCEMSAFQKFLEGQALFLAIHIHPEFNFTPKLGKSFAATQEVVLNYFNA